MAHVHTINTAQGMHDLIALAREIEMLEHQPRRLALRLAISQIEDLLIDVEADVRYVPVGWHVPTHVCWSVPPRRGLT